MAKEHECDGALIWTLPDETLLAVLEKLTVHWDRQSWCVVCKKFRDLDAMSRKFVGLMRIEFLEPVLRRYHHVERLGLHSDMEVNNVCLATVAKFTSQRLLSITLTGAEGFGIEGVRSLVKCTSFQEVNLSFCKEVRDKEVIALSELQHVQKLKLNGCEYVTDVGLSALSNCKELESLELNFCSHIGDVGIQNVAIGCLQLRTIDLSNTKVSDKGLIFLALLRNLECLNLKACKNVTDKGLEFLKSGCTTLQKLDVSWCPNVSSHALATLIERLVQLQELNLSYCKLTSSKLFISLQKLKMLQVIKLNGCSLDKDDLSLIGRGCRELKELSLWSCIGLKSIARCTKLRYLKIGSYMNITDAGLVHIGATCQNLLGFDCSRLVGIKDEDIAAMASGCRRLKRVVMSYCKFVTDASLQSLASLRDLQSLVLQACKQVTSVGVCHIAASCKRLLDLDVKHCSLVGDPGVLALSNGYQALLKINLSYTAVTDVGMMAVASMRCLRYMELGHMKVSINGLAMAIRTCSNLKYLKLPKGLCLALPFEVIKQIEECKILLYWMDDED